MQAVQNFPSMASFCNAGLGGVVFFFFALLEIRNG